MKQRENNEQLVRPQSSLIYRNQLKEIIFILHLYVTNMWLWWTITLPARVKRVSWKQRGVRKNLWPAANGWMQINIEIWRTGGKLRIERRATSRTSINSMFAEHNFKEFQFFAEPTTLGVDRETCKYFHSVLNLMKYHFFITCHSLLICVWMEYKYSLPHILGWIFNTKK